VRLNKNNFIDLIGRENIETAYSNFFKHIFESSPILFVKFANEVLAVDNLGNKIINLDNKTLNISKNITIESGEEHICLLITDEENVIVIEDKIKPGINAEEYNIYSDLVSNQLRDYYQYVNGNKKENNYYIPDEKLTKKYASKNAFLYIFVPDYIYADEDMPEERVLLGCVKYNIIKCSRIYNFFKHYYKDYLNKFSYYNEFLLALLKNSLI